MKFHSRIGSFIFTFHDSSRAKSTSQTRGLRGRSPTSFCHFPASQKLVQIACDWLAQMIRTRLLLSLCICIFIIMLNRSRALKSGGLLNRNRPWNPSLRLFLSTSSEVATPTTKKDAFYITTPIYYVNGEPHLGHAYTSVVSDVIARFQRKNNKNVYFLTGTDEHGQKVEQSANKNGQTPLEFADKVSDRFRQLSVVLNCSNDDFIRTTEERHQDAVCALWKKLEEKGQIYLGAYEGWYSIRDEAFYAESEIIDGKAPTGAEVEWVKEESYFFKLSDYTQKLLNFYDNNPDFIAPKSRRNEVISFVQQEGGLKDLSISRTTFSWGIPVPGSKEHVVYVWLDALTNYIAAIDYAKANDEKYETFWPACNCLHALHHL